MIPQRDFGLVLVAGGLGSRFGSNVPKQFWEIDGKPLYLRALEPFMDLVVEAVVVVPAGWEKKISGQVRSLCPRIPIQIQAGGFTRQESVSSGLKKLSSDTEYVLVHDAARPFVSSGLIEIIVQNTRKHGACIPVLPVRDTVKMVEDSIVVRTVDRRPLHLTQTPQGFELQLLMRAVETAQAEGFQGTDESSLVEHIGETVHVVEGEAHNIKVTWLEDLRSS